MKKKTKKAKKRTIQTEEFDREEVHDELLVLTAIFGEDLQIHESNEAFTLHVVPHPGEAETNYVSIKLDIRYVGAIYTLFATKLPADLPNFPNFPAGLFPSLLISYYFTYADTLGAILMRSFNSVFQNPKA